MQALHPVQRRSRIGQFAGAVVEFTLAAADRSEVEPQGRKAALLEHVEKLVYDLVVHRAAELRMRMQDDGDRGAFFLGGLVAAFKTAGGAVENNFGHRYSGRCFRFKTFTRMPV